MRVELMDDHFDRDTPDHIWVPEVGRRGWTILTKDKSLRHNYIELVALLKSGTHSFILTAGSQSGQEMASAFVTALPDIKQLIARFEPPLVATISAAGNVYVCYTRDQLIAQIASGQIANEMLTKSRKEK